MTLRRKMKQETTQFECDICGAKFTDGDALAKHLRVHEQGNDSGKLEQGSQAPTENPNMPPMYPGPRMRGEANRS